MKSRIFRRLLLKLIICFYILGLVIWIIGCQTDPYESVPLIRITESENKQYTYTNKMAGFYIGNSHKENEGNDQGWIVNNTQYLRDYRISIGPEMVSRDSVQQFLYYPTSFVRIYMPPIKETFTLLDSINTIVWEFDIAPDLMNFSFQPQFDQDSLNTTQILTAELPELIISPDTFWPYLRCSWLLRPGHMCLARLLYTVYVLQGGLMLLMDLSATRSRSQEPVQSRSRLPGKTRQISGSSTNGSGLAIHRIVP